jgi:hypothetical protein
MSPSGLLLLGHGKALDCGELLVRPRHCWIRWERLTDGFLRSARPSSCALVATPGVTYGALKLQFQLEDEHLQVLKEELIDGQQVAVDEGGKVLVWKASSLPAALTPSAPSPHNPRRATPRRIWLSVFSPNGRLWRLVAPPTVNVKPSPPSLLTSKAPQP